MGPDSSSKLDDRAAGVTVSGVGSDGDDAAQLRSLRTDFHNTIVTEFRNRVQQGHP